LRSWSKAPVDGRAFDQRPQALALYDFFHEQAKRLDALEGRDDLSLEDHEMKRELERILSEDAHRPTTLLAEILNGGRSKKRSTGDEKLDGWYDDLDRGEVPDEFWGPKGKPDKKIVDFGDLFGAST
jgi:hypothetical protein